VSGTYEGKSVADLAAVPLDGKSVDELNEIIAELRKPENAGVERVKPLRLAREARDAIIAADDAKKRAAADEAEQKASDARIAARDAKLAEAQRAADATASTEAPGDAAPEAAAAAEPAPTAEPAAADAPAVGSSPTPSESADGATGDDSSTEPLFPKGKAKP
jgi:hypothetical protein